MGNVSWAQILTYVAFLFVLIAYSVKVIKYLRMPLHLRWELYPVPHEKGREYGGSYMEELEWWTKPRSKNVFKDVNDMLKRYLFFGEYFRKNRGYWFGLYPWHIGFYLLMGFQALALLGALLVVTTGLAISSASANIGGVILYYLTIVVAVASFVTGIIGSIGLLIKRLTDQDLKAYASPENYFNYLFFLAVFLSLLFAWVYDPALSAYREFWVSLITASSVSLPIATYVFIVLFALHVIHLPFTRSTHYITKILTFFSVRWDDKPNLRGSDIERKVNKLLDQPVTWSAAHIQSGRTWREVVKGLPEDISGKQR